MPGWRRTTLPKRTWIGRNTTPSDNAFDDAFPASAAVATGLAPVQPPKGLPSATALSAGVGVAKRSL